MALCQATHIAPPPELGATIEGINAADGRSPGMAADLLTKLVRMLSEVRGLVGLWGLVGLGLGLSRTFLAPSMLSPACYKADPHHRCTRVQVVAAKRVSTICTMTQ